ncbi:MAG: hypothetical protein KTR20_12500 [Cellvibrionaceae bacterium]|nr:hypothetical protein [Cellvibrionaceae bacterium]
MQQHIIGWLVYVAVVIALLSVFWSMTAAIRWFYVKQCLRLSAAALLLMPTLASNTQLYWAPAWVVGFLELIFAGIEGFLPTGRLLLIAVVAALLIYCLLLLTLALYRRCVGRS